MLANLAADGSGRKHRVFDGLLIQYRQRTWKPKTHRADLRIRRTPKVGGTTAEGLGGREKLNMHFKTNHGFILCEDGRIKAGESGHTLSF
jgi:hypothetical protein